MTTRGGPDANARLGVLARVTCPRCGAELAQATARRVRYDATTADVREVTYAPEPVALADLLAWRCGHCGHVSGVDPEAALQLIRGRWRNRERTLRTARPAPAVILHGTAIPADRP